MKPLRVTYRLMLLLIHIFIGLLIVLVFGHQRDGQIPRGRFQRAVCWWLGRIPRIAGVRVHARGVPAPGPVLVVSNHVSWLDIPVLGGLAPVGFLSKAEVRHWPLVGWLAARTGTLFIRRGAHAAAPVTQCITENLEQGRRVHVFAEATTTDGTDVRRFHPRLLAAAQDTASPIQPVAIRYLPTPDGRPSPAPYIDDDVLLTHALRVLGEPRLDVEVSFLPPIAADQDRRSLADAAHQAVRAVVVDEATPTGDRERT